MLQNPLLRLLAWNWLSGAATAMILLVGILATNAMHLRDLILESDNPAVPILMLMMGFLVTFTSVAMATAVMGLGRTDDDLKGGRRERVEAAADDDGALIAVPIDRRGR